MDTKRFILFVALSFSILVFWNYLFPSVKPEPSSSKNVPLQRLEERSAPAGQSFQLPSSNRIYITTDLIKAELDEASGDLRKLSLLQHYADSSPVDIVSKVEAFFTKKPLPITKQKESFVLLNDKEPFYIAQTSLGIAEPLIFKAETESHVLQNGENTLKVILQGKTASGVVVSKIYTFMRGSYEIKIEYLVESQSTQTINFDVNYQIIHGDTSHQNSQFMPTFNGGAFYTSGDHYNKLSFEDMKEEDLLKNTNNGWIGFVQHYFVSAWIPQFDSVFYTKNLGQGLFAVGMKSSKMTLNPRATKLITTKLYAGPQLQNDLKKATEGLEYAVDYGWLTFIASPLFDLLAWIEKWVGNWGVAIIVLTIFIKLVFYPLSALGYKSMAKMKEVAPRLHVIRQKYEKDKQKLHQEMMALYRKEKINPMGGCFPILLQIPVFIALYWVLLGSVELRHAPFLGWITDLSARDPYLILPILMAITMYVQAKLNPQPEDPIQAKMMMIMPMVFSILFLFFPAGLVLYWVINNILSIAQQAQINRQIHQIATKRSIKSDKKKSPK